MFTEQIATLGAQLRRQGLDEATAAAFEQLLGSCSQTLSHRGTVNLPGAQFIQVPPSGQRADYTLVNLTAPTTVENNLTVEGDTTIGGDVVIEGDTTIEGDTICEGDIIVDGNPLIVYFPAKITAVEWITGTDGRYEYTFEEVEKTGAGHDGWTTKAGGRSGTAYNSIENVNSAQAVAAKVNEIVWIGEYSFTVGSVESSEYWFQYEEYDQDASGGGSDSSDSTPGTPPDDPGFPGYIDVMICGGWNRCGQSIVIPQNRIHIDSRGNITSIETIENEVIPIYQCESSGDEPPISSGDSEPPDSDMESSDFSWDLEEDSLTVSGTLTPDSTGIYTKRHYYAGHPVWGREDNAYAIYWSSVYGCWMIYGGNPGRYWYKSYDLSTPLGDYAPSTEADGIATVSVTP
jgi:hypothetical protein